MKVSGAMYVPTTQALARERFFVVPDKRDIMNSKAAPQHGHLYHSLTFPGLLAHVRVIVFHVVLRGC